MTMYGHNNIKKDELNRWVKTWDLNKICVSDVHTYEIIKDTVLRIQTLEFESLEALLPSCSDYIFQTFFRLDNGAVRIGNYYECFIKPVDYITYKRIIKGFDYKSFGEIKLIKNGTTFGSIGEYSDLLQCIYSSVLYPIDIEEYEEDGDINFVGTFQKSSKISDFLLSIQLYDVAGKSIEEIHDLVNQVFVELYLYQGLKFEKVYVDDGYSSAGNDGQIELELQNKIYDSIPLLYFKNAISSHEVRISFLLFYQVIEYYFYDATNRYMVNNGIASKRFSEKEQFKFVLDEVLEQTTFLAWLNIPQNMIKYCSPSDPYFIDLTTSFNDIISSTINRIYGYRCSIAHAKNNPNLFIALPELSNSIIENELPLVEFISKLVLNYYSK